MWHSEGMQAVYMYRRKKGTAEVWGKGSVQWHVWQRRARRSMCTVSGEEGMCVWWCDPPEALRAKRGRRAATEGAR